MPPCSSEGRLLAVLMLMAGLLYMLSRILQSQPGCFHSASHDFSSSNKLTPAGLHGSWQNSEREREKVWKVSQGLGSAQLQHHGQHTCCPKQVRRKPRWREERNRLLSWSEELQSSNLRADIRGTRRIMPMKPHSLTALEPSHSPAWDLNPQSLA